MHHAIRRLRGHRIGVHRVWIAAAVQQEVLVLHVREAFRVERHADEVEVRVETVDLQRILDVVGGRAVAVVVSVLATTCGGGGDCGHRVTAKDLGGRGYSWGRAITGSPASRTWVRLLRQ